MINIETNCESGDYKVSFEVGAPRQASTSSPARINLEAGKVERGLLKLVLSLVELIRQLMEKHHRSVLRSSSGIHHWVRGARGRSKKASFSSRDRVCCTRCFQIGRRL